MLGVDSGARATFEFKVLDPKPWLELTSWSGAPGAPVGFGGGGWIAGERVSFARHAQHDHHRKCDEAHTKQHGGADADHLLDLAVNAEPHDDAMKRDRNNERLEHERDRGGQVKMRRVLDVGLPSDR